MAHGQVSKVATCFWPQSLKHSKIQEYICYVLLNVCKHIVYTVYTSSFVCVYAMNPFMDVTCMPKFGNMSSRQLNSGGIIRIQPAGQQLFDNNGDEIMPTNIYVRNYIQLQYVDVCRCM